MQQKAEQLQKKNCGQLQPHVILLTEDGVNDNRVYAVIQGGLFYEVTSVIEAIDICMKSSFVFNLKFPEPAKSSWTFLQKAVYDIHTDSDFNGNRLSELLTVVGL